MHYVLAANLAVYNLRRLLLQRSDASDQTFNIFRLKRFVCRHLAFAISNDVGKVGIRLLLYVGGLEVVRGNLASVGAVAHGAL